MSQRLLTNCLIALSDKEPLVAIDLTVLPHGASMYIAYIEVSSTIQQVSHPTLKGKVAISFMSACTCPARQSCSGARCKANRTENVDASSVSGVSRNPSFAINLVCRRTHHDIEANSDFPLRFSVLQLSPGVSKPDALIAFNELVLSPRRATRSTMKLQYSAS